MVDHYRNQLRGEAMKDGRALMRLRNNWIYSDNRFFQGMHRDQMRYDLEYARRNDSYRRQHELEGLPGPRPFSYLDPRYGNQGTGPAGYSLGGGGSQNSALYNIPQGRYGAPQGEGGLTGFLKHFYDESKGGPQWGAIALGALFTGGGFFLGSSVGEMGGGGMLGTLAAAGMAGAGLMLAMQVSDRLFNQPVAPHTSELAVNTPARSQSLTPEQAAQNEKALAARAAAIAAAQQKAKDEAAKVSATATRMPISDEKHSGNAANIAVTTTDKRTTGAVLE